MSKNHGRRLAKVSGRWGQGCCAARIHRLTCGSVQMQAVLGEKRPNCLVIDEIDGALGDGSSGGASGVRELANILRTGRIASSEKEPSAEASGAPRVAPHPLHVCMHTGCARARRA